MRDAVPLVVDLLVHLYDPFGRGGAHSVEAIPFQLVGSGIDFLISRSVAAHGVQHGLNTTGPKNKCSLRGHDSGLA